MLIGFHGLPSAGKDESAKYLAEQYGFKRIAFADPMREGLLRMDPFIDVGLNEFEPLRVAIAEWGWDNAKRRFPEVRRLLRQYGTEAGRDIHGPNCWSNIGRDKIYEYGNQGHNEFVFTDVRFHNEVEMVHSEGGFICEITSPRSEQPSGHSSDTRIPEDQIAYKIENDGTIVELHQKLDDLVEFARENCSDLRPAPEESPSPRPGFQDTRTRQCDGGTCCP